MMSIWNFSPEEAKRLLRALKSRRLILHNIIESLCGPFIFLWMGAFGLITDPLENTQYDILGYLYGIGILGIVVIAMISIGFPVLIVLTLLYYRKRLIRKMVRQHLQAPKCFFCGYDLRHQVQQFSNNDLEWVRCPECGKKSPYDNNACHEN